jgi:hypothetical protein
MNSHKLVSILAAIALCVHAFLGIYNGELMLKGGSDISLSSNPVSFVGIIIIEIAVSIYVIWAFVIKEEKKTKE